VKAPTAGPVRELLAGMAGRTTVHFLPSPGNGGDALIDVGFFDLARSVGLSYRVIDRRAELGANDTLVIAGGGIFVPEYEYMATTLRRYAQSVGQLVLLPQTVRGHEDVLGLLDERAHVFLREQTSLDYLVSVAPAAHPRFDHDMAFHADVAALRARRGLAGFRLSRGNLGRLALLTALKLNALTTRRLLAFRTDREAGGTGHARLARDVSKLTAFGTATEDQCRFAAAQFIQTIDRFAEVDTDRLHVAIAAALLGKPARLHDNSYFKNRAVFAASLQGTSVTMAHAAAKSG